MTKGKIKQWIFTALPILILTTSARSPKLYLTFLTCFKFLKKILLNSANYLEWNKRLTICTHEIIRLIILPKVSTAYVLECVQLKRQKSFLLHILHSLSNLFTFSLCLVYI